MDRLVCRTWRLRVYDSLFLRMMLMALGGSQLHPVLGKHVGLGGEQDAQAGARVEDGYQDVSA